MPTRSFSAIFLPKSEKVPLIFISWWIKDLSVIAVWVTSLQHHRILRVIHRVRVNQFFLSEGGSRKETFTHTLDGFLLYSSLLFCVLLTVYIFPYNLFYPTKFLRRYSNCNVLPFCFSNEWLQWIQNKL